MILAVLVGLVCDGRVEAQLADLTQPGDPIVPTSNNSPGSEGVANAIDNQPTKYLNFDRLNTGFTVTPSAGLSLITGLTLTSANDAPERDPASYTLYGSNDGISFLQISSGSVAPFPLRFFKQYIFFPDNTKPFTAYRLIFPTVAGPGGNSMQISEVELLGIALQNRPPVAVDDPVMTLQDLPVSISVLGNDTDPDNDPLAVSFVSTPMHGIAVINLDGGVTYTPSAAYVGPDSFDYTVVDGQGNFASATVNVTVAAPPTPTPSPTPTSTPTSTPTTTPTPTFGAAAPAMSTKPSAILVVLLFLTGVVGLSRRLG